MPTTVDNDMTNRFLKNMIFEGGAPTTGGYSAAAYDPDEIQSQDDRAPFTQATNDPHDAFMQDQVGLDDFPLDHEFPEDYDIKEEDDDMDGCVPSFGGIQGLTRRQSLPSLSLLDYHQREGENQGAICRPLGAWGKEVVDDHADSEKARPQGKTNSKKKEKRDTVLIALLEKVEGMISKKDLREKKRRQKKEEQMNAFVEIQRRRLEMDAERQAKMLELEEAKQAKMLEIESTNAKTKAKEVALASMKTGMEVIKRSNPQTPSQPIEVRVGRANSSQPALHFPHRAGAKTAPPPSSSRVLPPPWSPQPPPRPRPSPRPPPPVAAPAPAPAPAAAAPAPAPHAPTIVEDVVAATHVGAKRRRAGLASPPPAPIAVAPAPTTVPPAPAKKRRSKVSSRGPRGASSKAACASPKRKKVVARKKPAAPAVDVAEPPPAAHEVFEEMATPTSFMDLLQDAEVDLGAPPLEPFGE
ncbi:eyes absent-like protein 4 [Hordeum vulgare]|nr:eyes absent-like protein 4 [Hordeum vulgare]